MAQIYGVKATGVPCDGCGNEPVVVCIEGDIELIRLCQACADLVAGERDTDKQRASAREGADDDGS